MSAKPSERSVSKLMRFLSMIFKCSLAHRVNVFCWMRFHSASFFVKRRHKFDDFMSIRSTSFLSTHLLLNHVQLQSFLLLLVVLDNPVLAGETINWQRPDNNVNKQMRIGSKSLSCNYCRRLSVCLNDRESNEKTSSLCKHKASNESSDCLSLFLIIVMNSFKFERKRIREIRDVTGEWIICQQNLNLFLI